MRSPRRKISRPFQYLQELTSFDYGLETQTDSLSLFEEKPFQGKLLGIYGFEEIQEALVRYGLQSSLDSWGIGKCDIKLDTRDRSRQMMQLISAEGNMVSEVIISESTFLPKEAIPGIFPGKMDFLVVQWLCLQDTRRNFSADRLPLPGQLAPGLGVGLNVMEMILALAAKLEVAGIVNRPEFLHNAILYEPYFLFLHPDVQGRFDSLMRDLSKLSFIEQAWAGYSGAIIDEQGRSRFSWYQSEQLRSASPELDEYFASETYQTLRHEAAHRSHFQVNQERLDEVLAEVKSGIPSTKN
jgi:hypothetical protein